MKRIVFLVTLLLSSCSFSKTWNDIPVSWSKAVEGFGNTLLSRSLILGFRADAKALIAIDVQRKSQWSANIQSSISPIPYRQLETDGDYIFAYIPGDGLHIYSLTGDLLSRVPPPSKVSPQDSYGVYGAGPTLSKTTLYLPVDGLLLAYNVADPKQPELIWEREFTGGSIWALAVDEEGKIYVGIIQKGLGSLQALNPINGQTIWTANTALTNNPAESGTPTALTVLGNKVIAALSNSFDIQAFDRTSGERLYASDSLEVLCPDGQGRIFSIEVAEGNLYVSPSSGTCVYGVNAETGKVLWTHSSRVDPDTTFSYGGKPKYLNGIVYVSNSALWALDAKTGRVLALASHRDEYAIATNIQIVNGEILVWGKNLTAYKPIR